MMLRSCNKCGKIHEIGYKCKAGQKRTYKKTEERTFRNKNKWHLKAEEIKRSAYFLCEVCRDKGLITYNALEVHHITPLKEDIEKGLENENLITLCKEHHEEAEAGKLTKEYLEELARKRERGEPLGVPPSIS